MVCRMLLFSLHKNVVNHILATHLKNLLPTLLAVENIVKMVNFILERSFYFYRILVQISDLLVLLMLELGFEFDEDLLHPMLTLSLS